MELYEPAVILAAKRVVGSPSRGSNSNAVFLRAPSTRKGVGKSGYLPFFGCAISATWFSQNCPLPMNGPGSGVVMVLMS